jgi:hypothetical protein
VTFRWRPMRRRARIAMMPNMTRRRVVIAVVAAAISLAFFVRGWGYYWGPGPHDGEDIPSFAMFLVGTIMVFVAALAWRGGPRRRAVSWIALGLSGLLLLATLGWYALNVELEQWAK